MSPSSNSFAPPISTSGLIVGGLGRRRFQNGLGLSFGLIGTLDLRPLAWFYVASECAPISTIRGPKF
jgi:hypothetical protein